MKLKRQIFRERNSSAFGTIIAVAGADQTIIELSDITTLDGTGSSSDVAGGVTGYLWEVVSGSGLVIDSPTSSTTDISGTAVVGDHIIRLTVTDNNGNIDIDELMITVEVGDIIQISATPADSNKQGTLSIVDGVASESITLQFHLLGGDYPDTLSFGAGSLVLDGALDYSTTSQTGTMTLDGSGEADSTYFGSGDEFQVSVLITARSSGKTIPPNSKAYISIFTPDP